MWIEIGVGLLAVYLIIGLGFFLSALLKNMGCFGSVVIALTWPLGLFFRGGVW